MARETVGAPEMAADIECWAPDGRGGISRVWAARIPHNVVVEQGRGQLLNRALGFQTASTFGPYLHLLSATTASNQVWSNVSASGLGSYGANVPQMSFATTYTNGTATGTVSYGFTAGTQTVSGAALLWFTTNTLATSNLSSTGGIAMYNHGLFAASQQVQANNTISVSATFAINTSN